jgi:hypothetical protein
MEGALFYSAQTGTRESLSDARRSRIGYCRLLMARTNSSALSRRELADLRMTIRPAISARRDKGRAGEFTGRLVRCRGDE